MPGATHHLLAILAPGSAEAEVGRLQQEIFASFGFASAIALPPLIPLRFLPEGTDPGLLERTGGSIPAAYRISTLGSSWHGGGLYLAVDSAGVWDSVRSECTALLGLAAEGTGLFPVFDGFCLGCWEAREEDRQRPVPSAPRISFTSCALALLSIECAGEPASWWREVYLEVLWKKPLRGKKRQV